MGIIEKIIFYDRIIYLFERETLQNYLLYDKTYTP